MIFDIVAVIDWSAANSPGPLKPSADRCWIAWASQQGISPPEYFRTRRDCMNRLQALTKLTAGSILFAFDFPFGYPAGSGLGGGRKAGAILAEHLKSDENDRNNRFEVAHMLNHHISGEKGPFWGRPASYQLSNLTQTKPAFTHSHFKEWRLAEKHLRDQKYRIMNVWQLLGQGSVGSQTLTGLTELYQFSEHSDLKKRTKFWPFDTQWDKNLDGIILAEVWPSLCDYEAINHPIKDARQVSACLNWLWAQNRSGHINALFAAPDFLNETDQKAVMEEEGWILGAFPS